MVDRDRGRHRLSAFRIHPPYRLCEQYSQEHIGTAVIFAAQLHDRRFGQSQIEVSLFPIIILQFLFHPVEIQNRLFGVKRLCGFQIQFRKRISGFKHGKRLARQPESFRPGKGNGNQTGYYCKRKKGKCKQKTQIS